MTTTPSKQSVNGAEPGHSVGSRRHRQGFWVVAFAFLVVMALGTVRGWSLASESASKNSPRKARWSSSDQARRCAKRSTQPSYFESQLR